MVFKVAAMPQMTLACALVSTLVLGTLPAQFPTNAEDWRMPFRPVNEHVEVDGGLFDELRNMERIASKAAKDSVRFEHGVEVCDHPGWESSHEAVLSHTHAAGVLSDVIRRSSVVADRATAFYGAFYNKDPQLVFAMIEHIPGEPLRRIREDAYRRASEFVEAHFAKRNPGDLAAWQKIKVGPAGVKPPRPGDLSHRLDPLPFLAMLATDDGIDQSQALWFLGECVRAEPSYCEEVLALGYGPIRHLLTDGEAVAKKQAIDFVALVDPQQREAPELDAGEEALLAWFAVVIKEIFPPIRHISSGLIELYPSEELDAIVATGKAGLTSDTLGAPTTGQLSGGEYYRGFRLGELPETLAQLGLEPGQVVTAINGSPVGSAEDMLQILTVTLKHSQSVLVEYVHGGTKRAKEYRLR